MSESVRIREVGPRDGFQNEPERIPTEDKIRLINALARTGLKRMEVGSFVRADVLPQLADIIDVLHGIDVPDDVDLTVLVPNERGLDNALGHADRFHTVGMFVSASETHNQRNVNRTIEESMAGLERMAARARDAGLNVSAIVATAFGCPYEGHVDPDHVRAMARQLADAGATEVGFGDTTGMANPRQVQAFFSEDGFPDVELTAHFHNTRGQGLANAVAALDAGVRSFESSFGELGGCPVPKGSTGNIASEDLISMFHEMGVETGIDLDALIACSRDVQSVLDRPLTSHVLVAGGVDWQPR